MKLLLSTGRATFLHRTQCGELVPIYDSGSDQFF